MFPSTASGCNPFEPLFNRSYFLSDQTPSSEQVHNPPLLSSLPLPFFDERELPLNPMLSQNQLVDRINLDSSDETTKNNRVGASTKSNEKEIDLKVAVAPLRRRNLGVIPRRRPGKKDRHSKICTAHGIRDRRMRLSLQVARKFFDLQDMLGFDKASKTIEWLFTNSKKAIKELKQTISDRKSESFLSDCEVASDIEESPRNDVRESSTPADATALCIEQNETKFDQKNACKSYMRESRDKARARARSRTREKMLIKLAEDSGPGYKPNPGHDYYLETLGFPNSPSGGVDQASSSQKRVSPYEDVYHPIEHQLSDVDTTEKLLGNSRSSAPVSSSWPISDHKSFDAVAASGYINSNCDFFGFLGNWDLLSCDSISSSQYAVADQVSGQGYNLYPLYSTTPDFQ